MCLPLTTAAPITKPADKCATVKCGVKGTVCKDGMCVDVTDSKQNCCSWFDGCNMCTRESPTAPFMCTERFCLVQGVATCKVRHLPAAVFPSFFPQLSFVRG